MSPFPKESILLGMLLRVQKVGHVSWKHNKAQNDKIRQGPVLMKVKSNSNI